MAYNSTFSSFLRWGAAEAKARGWTPLANGLTFAYHLNASTQYNFRNAVYDDVAGTVNAIRHPILTAEAIAKVAPGALLFTARLAVGDPAAEIQVGDAITSYAVKQGNAFNNDVVQPFAHGNYALAGDNLGADVGTVGGHVAFALVTAPVGDGALSVAVDSLRGVGILRDAAVAARAAPLLLDAESEVPLITQNKIAGDAFRDELAGALRAEGRDVTTEVYKSTPFGKRFIDIEVSQDGKVLGGIETKVGSSRYTWTQQLKDWWLKDAQGYTVNVARDK